MQTRRKFISSCVAGVFSACASTSGIARSADNSTLELLALHTNESVRVTYRANGKLLPANLLAIDKVLRDHRTNEVHAIDPDLLDFLHDLGDQLGHAGAFHVISGYRSKSTNDKLRRASSGVARRSFHMFGRAVDIRVPHVPVQRVRDVAISLKRGGVGFYPRSDFVHLDTGRNRHW